MLSVSAFTWAALLFLSLVAPVACTQSVSATDTLQRASQLLPHLRYPPPPLPPEERNSPRKTPKLEGTKEGSRRVDAHPPHARVHALCPAFHGTGLAVAGSAQFSEAKWLTEVLRHFPPQFKFMTNKQTSTRSGDKESKAGPDAERQASKLRQAASPQGRQRTLLRSKSL